MWLLAEKKWSNVSVICDLLGERLKVTFMNLTLMPVDMLQSLHNEIVWSLNGSHMETATVAAKSSLDVPSWQKQRGIKCY